MTSKVAAPLRADIVSRNDALTLSLHNLIAT
jgi:hypothetical protein